MNAIRVCVLSIVAVHLGIGGPVMAQDAKREEKASVIQVRTFENQPIEVTYTLPARASAQSLLPESIVVRNTSIYAIAFGAINIVFPELPDGDERFLLQVGWGKNIIGASNYITRDALSPGETVVLPIPSEYGANLTDQLNKQHRHIDEIHEVVIALDCLRLDNGYNFVPSGYVRVQ